MLRCLVAVVATKQEEDLAADGMSAEEIDPDFQNEHVDDSNECITNKRTFHSQSATPLFSYRVSFRKVFHAGLTH